MFPGMLGLSSCFCSNFSLWLPKFQRPWSERVFINIFQGAPGQTTKSPHLLLQPWHSHLILRWQQPAPMATSPQHGCPGPSLEGGFCPLSEVFFLLALALGCGSWQWEWSRDSRGRDRGATMPQEASRKWPPPPLMAPCPLQCLHHPFGLCCHMLKQQVFPFLCAVAFSRVQKLRIPGDGTSFAEVFGVIPSPCFPWVFTGLRCSIKTSRTA